MYHGSTGGARRGGVAGGALPRRMGSIAVRLRLVRLILHPDSLPVINRERKVFVVSDPLGAAAGRQFGRRLLLLVDAKGYGACGPIRQREFQEAIPRLVEAAAQAAGLEYADWLTQAQGDALFAVLPDGASEPALVDTFTRALEAGLRNFNDSRVAEAWLRLRVAVHYGPASGGDLGFVGPGPVELARLNGSAGLRAALKQSPQAHLALGVTAVIYGDVIRPGYTTLRPGQFRQIEVAEKEYRGSAWIWVPNASSAGGSAASGAGTSTASDFGAVPEQTVPEQTAPEQPALPAGDPRTVATVTMHNHDFDARGAVIGIQL